MVGFGRPRGRQRCAAGRCAWTPTTPTGWSASIAAATPRGSAWTMVLFAAVQGSIETGLRAENPYESTAELLMLLASGYLLGRSVVAWLRARSATHRDLQEAREPPAARQRALHLSRAGNFARRPPFALGEFDDRSRRLGRGRAAVVAALSRTIDGRHCFCDCTRTYGLKT